MKYLPQVLAACSFVLSAHCEKIDSQFQFDSKADLHTNFVTGGSGDGSLLWAADPAPSGHTGSVKLQADNNTCTPDTRFWGICEKVRLNFLEKADTATVSILVRGDAISNATDVSYAKAFFIGFADRSDRDPVYSPNSNGLQAVIQRNGESDSYRLVIEYRSGQFLKHQADGTGFSLAKDRWYRFSLTGSRTNEGLVGTAKIEDCGTDGKHRPSLIISFTTQPEAFSEDTAILNASVLHPFFAFGSPINNLSLLVASNFAVTAEYQAP